MQIDIPLMFVYTTESGYHYVEAEMGDILLLRCNSSKSSELKWTHRPTYENRTYVYSNGSTDYRYETEKRYSFVTSVGGEFSLRIYNAQVGDSGRFDCSDSDNVRRSEYQLNVTGALIASCTNISSSSKTNSSAHRYLL